MAFCGKCGAQIEDGAKFCSVCGAEVISAEQQNENAQTAETETKSDFGAKISGLNNTEDTTENYDSADIQSNKGIALISYIGILGLIPLFAKKDSPFTQYHAKQGFTLLLLYVAVGIVSGLLSLIKTPVRMFGITYAYATPWFISLICFLLYLIPIILSIIGIVNAVQGRAKELPVIGKIKILK